MHIIPLERETSSRLELSSGEWSTWKLIVMLEAYSPDLAPDVR